MTPLARIEEERRGAVLVASVVGEIDASNAAWAGERLRRMLGNDSSGLVLDLTRTTYLDSAGIAVAYALAAELDAHRQDLWLVVEPDSSMARVVALSGLDRAVPTHPTVEAALAPPRR